MATTQHTRPGGHEAADRDGLPSPFMALHHVALVTNDMKKTVAFYRDVLGSEVAMGHRLDRPGNERHYFITVAPNTVFAFFEFPDATMPAYKDATLPSTGRSLDHVCFHVEDDAAFDAWYQRIGDKGVKNRSEIIERGPSRSFFFSDPNNIVFEVATLSKGQRFPIREDPDPAY